jgi:hypothetical protein
MNANLGNLLSNLHVEEPITCGHLRLTPLSLSTDSDLEYVTLDDQLGDDITVEEISASGSVPELRVHNRSSQRVFIFEGTTLVGAKQNRAVNISIMLSPKSATAIPVSCVERGRWNLHTRHFNPSWFSDCHLRGMMSADAMTSLKRTGKVEVSQRAVWEHVENLLCKGEIPSPTRAYNALFDKWDPELIEDEAKLRPPERASGIAVEIDGRFQAVDLFDKPATLKNLWPKLVRSHVLSAHSSLPARGRMIDVNELLQRVLSSAGESFRPAGVGESVRWATDGAVGAALLCEGRLVHLSLFADTSTELVPSTRFPQEKLPVNDPAGSGRRRSWWRFWL